jgi:hypothetical protein
MLIKINMPVTLYLNTQNGKLHLIAFMLQKSLPHIQFIVKPINQLTNENRTKRIDGKG